MNEVGESPGAVQELTSRPASATAEPWRAAERRVFSSRVFGMRPPNTRVQRTRSSASPPHSPLTRHPLGSPK